MKCSTNSGIYSRNYKYLHVFIKMNQYLKYIVYMHAGANGKGRQENILRAKDPNMHRI